MLYDSAGTSRASAGHSLSYDRLSYDCDGLHVLNHVPPPSPR